MTDDKKDRATHVDKQTERTKPIPKSERPSVQSNEKPATQQSDDKGPPPGGKD